MQTQLQIKVHVPRDDILRTCTKIYRNYCEVLIPNFKVTWISIMIPFDFWSHRLDLELSRAPRVQNIAMLSIQVMKRTIKSLPLLGKHLDSIAIKQLNEQIVIAVLNIGRCYNTLFYSGVPISPSVHCQIACSNALHGSRSSHARST